MKHYYIGIGLLLSSLNLFAQNGQLENSGFENWNTQALYETPAQWFSSNQLASDLSPTVFKSTDAQTGSYSAECRSLGNDAFSYVGLGQLGNGPEGGIPYTSDVTSLKFMYKSQFQAGDSLYVYVLRFLGGNMIGEYVAGAAYDTHSSWTEATFTIPAGIQDQLFIAFLTASPIASTNNSADSWFRIDNVRLFNGSTQGPALPNFSLENWTTVSVEDPVSWYTINSLAGATGFQTTTKSTDSHSGTYAAQLKTTYSADFDENLPGLLALTDLTNNSGVSGIPYVAIPSFFSCWYKFTPSATGNDGSIVNITFFKESQPIASYSHTFTDAAAYTEFVLPIDLTEQPDSVNVTFFSGDNDGATLKIDDLHFSGGSVGLDQFAKSALSIYPNPASDKVMIRAEGTYSWEIVTLSGTVVMSGKAVSGAQEINLSGISAGAYFVRLNGDSSGGMHKLTVQ